METQSHCPASLQSFSELPLSTGSPNDRPFSPPGDLSSQAVATSQICKTAQACRKEQENVRGQGESYGHATTISMLPDDVLLEIFDQYKKNDGHIDWNWVLLVHICRRWRQVVFSSPLRLDLNIRCTSRSPVRKNLDSWPALPIIIDITSSPYGLTTDDEDNVVTALEHVDRVCDIKLDARCSELEKIVRVMQEPFPVLRRLYIYSRDWKAPVLPSEFLGGSAPCLQEIDLHSIPFAALSTLLLSTSDLVYLNIRNIPPSGYISPEGMVAGLAALPRLEEFIVEFQTAFPCDRMHPPPVTRNVLPSLTFFYFQGTSTYLGDLASRIDTPQLNHINIHFFEDCFDTPPVAQLPKLIDRSFGPKLALFKYAHVAFGNFCVYFDTYCHANDPDLGSPFARTSVDVRGINRQFWYIAVVLSHFPPTISHVVHLKLGSHHSLRQQLEDTDDMRWPRLLRQFSHVKTLCVNRLLAGRIALALEGITMEMIAEVLPSLNLIFLEDQRASSIERFIAARQLSGRSVTVVDTITEFDERLKSYITE